MYRFIAYSILGASAALAQVNVNVQKQSGTNLITGNLTIGTGLILQPSGSGQVIASSTTGGLTTSDVGVTVQPFITTGSASEYYRGDKTWATWINSDWNASSGGAQILNKPTAVSAFTNDAGYVTNAGLSSTLSNYVTASTLSGTLTNYVTTSTLTSTLASYVTSASLTSTLGSYVTSASLSSTLSSYATTSALSSGLAGKFNTPAGTTAQYIRGDGSLATFPSITSGTVTSITAGTGLSGGTITTSGTISLPNTGTAGTYSGVTTDAQGRVTAGTTRAFNNPTRSLNTAFQLTRDTFVSYTVDIAATLTLSGGATGTVTLEYADDSGISVNVVTVQSSVNGNTGALTVGLSLTQTSTASIAGIIPANKYVRIRTTNTAGTPSFTYRYAQEVGL